MNELWAITVALPHETKGILPKMSVQSQTSYGNLKLYEGLLEGKECILLQTGMGVENAKKGSRFLVDEFPITHLISTGYCGALVPDLKNSEAVLATELFSAEDPSQKISSDDQFLSKVQSRFEKNGVSFQIGPLVTSSRPVLKTEEKEELARRSKAIAVDMESFSVLKEVQERKKITSLTVRFVVDALTDDFGDTEAFMDIDSGFKPKGLVREVLRRPKILVNLPGFERKARKARHSLGNSICIILKDHGSS